MNAIAYTRESEIQRGYRIDELLEKFRRYLDVSPATERTYIGHIRQFIKYLDTQGISNPSRDDILAYKEHLKTYCKATTIQAYIEALRVFFSWTEEEQLYPNIANHVKGAKVSRNHKKDYLNAEQLRIILADIDTTTESGLRDYAIIALMIACGLRTIEVTRADIEDLTTVGGECVLYVQGKGRTEKAEFVKVPIEVESAINRYLRARTGKEAAAPLFTSTSNNSKGARLTTRSIRGLVKRYFRESGFDSDRLTAHSLRHSAVTLSLIGGASLQETQQFARHSDISTTMIYAHNLDRMANTCNDRLANAVFR